MTTAREVWLDCREAAAAAIDSGSKPPCGCMNPDNYSGCDCHNTGDTVMESDYWACKYSANKIRALPCPYPEEATESAAPTDAADTPCRHEWYQGTCVHCNVTPNHVQRVKQLERALAESQRELAKVNAENEVLREMNFAMNKTIAEEKAIVDEHRDNGRRLMESADGWKVEAERLRGIERALKFANEQPKPGEKYKAYCDRCYAVLHVRSFKEEP